MFSSGSSIWITFPSESRCTLSTGLIVGSESEYWILLAIWYLFILRDPKYYKLCIRYFIVNSVCFIRCKHSLKRNGQDDCQYVHDEVIYISDGEICSGSELTSWTFQWDFNIVAPYMEFLHLNWYIAEWWGPWRPFSYTEEPTTPSIATR